MIESTLGLEQVPPGRQIYSNRTLNLRTIRAIGYDMDYTLLHYDAVRACHVAGLDPGEEQGQEESGAAHGTSLGERSGRSPALRSTSGRQTPGGSSLRRCRRPEARVCP